MTTLGVCRNPACSKAAAGEILERYPGPGEYCPECGETLDPDAVSQHVSPHFSAAIFNAFAPASRAPFWRRTPVVAALAVAMVAAVGLGVLGALRTLGESADPIRVCRASLTDRVARDVVRAFAQSDGIAPSRFTFVTSNCDVRFGIGPARTGDQIVGHDALVVVVNPQNPIAELSLAQVHAILSGAVTDWTELGGTQGAISVLAPPDGSDEARLLGTTLLHGGHIGAAASRARPAAIVAKVSAADGRARVGVVPFSAAVPAKVVRIASLPVPSTLAISDHRYPFAFDVTVSGDGGRGHLVADLLAYVRSDAAQAIVVHDGLIAKERF